MLVQNTNAFQVILIHLIGKDSSTISVEYDTKKLIETTVLIYP